MWGTGWVFYAANRHQTAETFQGWSHAVGFLLLRNRHKSRELNNKSIPFCFGLHYIHKNLFFISRKLCCLASHARSPQSLKPTYIIYSKLYRVSIYKLETQRKNNKDANIKHYFGL
jgi:hypothetical protein